MKKRGCDQCQMLRINGVVTHGIWLPGRVARLQARLQRVRQKLHTANQTAAVLR